MPLQRRMPKRGFRSKQQALIGEVRLHALGKLDVDVIDLAALKAANLVASDVLRAKVFLAGTLERPVTLKGIAATKGALAAITRAGGKVED